MSAERAGRWAGRLPTRRTVAPTRPRATPRLPRPVIRETDAQRPFPEWIGHRDALIVLAVVLGQERGVPPTVRELGDVCGLASPATVQGRVDRLRIAGLVDRAEPGIPRSLTTRLRRIPFGG